MNIGQRRYDFDNLLLTEYGKKLSYIARETHVVF